jgi:hypothetical protein
VNRTDIVCCPRPGMILGNPLKSADNAAVPDTINKNVKIKARQIIQ